MGKKTKNHRDELMRADAEFKKMLKEIRLERFKRGLDKEPLSSRRLTLALSRVPKLKDVLLEAKITDEIVK